MENLTAEQNPELKLDMEALRETTEGHCDEWNRRHQQLLDNDSYLNNAVKAKGAPVHIGMTAPSDPSALWVKTDFEV